MNIAEKLRPLLIAPLTVRQAVVTVRPPFIDGVASAVGNC